MSERARQRDSPAFGMDEWVCGWMMCWTMVCPRLPVSNWAAARLDWAACWAAFLLDPAGTWEGAEPIMMMRAVPLAAGATVA